MRISFLRRDAPEYGFVSTVSSTLCFGGPFSVTPGKAGEFAEGPRTSREERVLPSGNESHGWVGPDLPGATGKDRVPGVCSPLRKINWICNEDQKEAPNVWPADVGDSQASWSLHQKE